MYQGSETRLDYNILGNPGAGQAFLLNPQSAAANTFAHFVGNDLEMRNRQALMTRQLRAAARENAIGQLKDFKLGGDHFISDNDELQRKYHEAMKYASEVVDRGGDPYADSTFRTMQQDVLSDGALSKAHKDEYNAGLKLINEKPTNYRNVKEWMDWYTKPLSERKRLLKEGIMAPTLQQRFSEKDLIDMVPAAKRMDADGTKKVWGGDRIGAHRQVDSIHDTEQFKFILENKYGGNPALGHFGTRSKEGFLVYPTDEKYATDYADYLLEQSQSNPEILQEMGLDTGDPELKNKLVNTIRRQNQAYGQVTKNVVNGSVSKIESGYEWDDAKARLGLAREQMTLNKAKEARLRAGDESTAKVNKYLNTLSDKLLAQDPEAINNLRAHLRDLNGEVSVNGSYLEIKIPAEIEAGFKWVKNNKGQWIKARLDPMPTKPGQFATQMQIDEYKKELAAWKQENISGNNILYDTRRIKKGSGQEGYIQLENLYKKLGLVPEKNTPTKFGYDPGDIGIYE